MKKKVSNLNLYNKDKAQNSICQITIDTDEVEKIINLLFASSICIECLMVFLADLNPEGSRSDGVDILKEKKMLCEDTLNELITKILMEGVMVDFEETYNNLKKCYERMADDLSHEDKEFKLKLLELCSDILVDFGDELKE